MGSNSNPDSGNYEDPLAGPTWTWFIAGSVACLAIAIGVAALLYDMQEDLANEFEATSEVAALEDYREEQHARLNDPARRELRADHPDEPALVIPIEDAMRLIVEEAASGS